MDAAESIRIIFIIIIIIIMLMWKPLYLCVVLLFDPSIPFCYRESVFRDICLLDIVGKDRGFNICLCMYIIQEDYYK